MLNTVVYKHSVVIYTEKLILLFSTHDLSLYGIVAGQESQSRFDINSIRRVDVRIGRVIKATTRDKPNNSERPPTECTWPPSLLCVTRPNSGPVTYWW